MWQPGFANLSSPSAKSRTCDAQHGAEDRVTLGIRREYARALYVDEKASPEELRESEEILDDLCRTTRRVLGPIHEQTHLALEELVAARKRRAEVRAGEA